MKVEVVFGNTEVDLGSLRKTIIFVSLGGTTMSATDAAVEEKRIQELVGNDYVIVVARSD